MTLTLLMSVLLVGFTLGLVHALDPDHLVTIAALSAREDANGATLRFAATWAMGHGGLLVTVATAVLLLGWSFPDALSHGAERAVGAVLIVTGISALWFLRRQRGQAVVTTPVAGLRQKAPFAVGMIHGLAGSASMLALVPITLYSPVVGLAYAVIFSAGVLAGMLGFGLVLDRLRSRLVSGWPALHHATRFVFAIGAIGMGTYWLHAA